MNVLLVIYNYEAAFPFIQDLEKNLKTQQGVQVDVLDTNNLTLRRHAGGKEELAGPFARLLMRLPRIGHRLKAPLLRRLLAGMKGRYDVVNIHNCDEIYIHLMDALRGITDQVYTMMWGSDFYRASEAMRARKKIIFDKSRYVMFANPVNARDLTSYYNDYRDKAIINGFGVAKFDLIRAIGEQQSITELKEHFGFPQDKIVVAVGYNGTKGQQHVELLDEIARLPEAVRARLFLVLQMTYGFQQDYCSGVEARAKELGLKYKLLKDFFNDEETARLRLAIDVVLNAQVTDGFSSSIQEHIFARNIVVVGDWLPYQPLELARIFYLRTPLDGFHAVLSDVVARYGEMKAETQGNSEKIYELSSWNHRIKSWVSIYRGEGARFLYQENDLKIS